MNDDKPQPKDSKDKAPATNQADDAQVDYAFGDINEAQGDKVDEGHDTHEDLTLKGKDRKHETGSRLLGEGQERVKPDDDDEQIRQSS
ncbi:MAG: hypothetical protein KC547_23430 [Anaerolineae bacterium]|nr:hypothetical protein [Anaerolineae bacterium]